MGQALRIGGFSFESAKEAAPIGQRRHTVADIGHNNHEEVEQANQANQANQPSRSSIRQLRLSIPSKFFGTNIFMQYYYHNATVITR